MKRLQNPRPARWRREWIVLGQPHIAFLDRIAAELGVTPSAIVRQLIEKAITGEPIGPVVTVKARFTIGGLS